MLTSNKYIKILCSVPVMLILLFLIKPLGIALAIFSAVIHAITYRQIKKPIWLIVVGVVLIIPKAIASLLGLITTGVIPAEITNFFNFLVGYDFYNIKLVEYSKLLIIVGVATLILEVIVERIYRKIKGAFGSGGFIKKAVDKYDAKQTEIAKENDLKVKMMKEQVEIAQEKAKNTATVKCPSCGATITISEKVGTCEYCRCKISNPSYKS